MKRIIAQVVLKPIPNSRRKGADDTPLVIRCFEDAYVPTLQSRDFEGNQRLDRDGADRTTMPWYLRGGRISIKTSSVSPRLSPLVPEIVALLGGILSAVIIALPVNTFFDFVPFETIIMAPIVEEPAKATGVIFLAVSYPYVISDKTRGLLLGGLAGLGFAFTENLFYASIQSTDVVARALLPVPLHIMASGVAAMGLVYLAQNRMKTNRELSVSHFRLRNVASLFAVAVAIHMQYNLLSYFGYLGSLLGLMITGFVYYRLGRTLPADLRFFTVPGPVGILKSTVQVRVLRTPFPASKTTLSSITTPSKQDAYCIICGHRISNGERFCDRCGEAQR
jgi:hypothetical protein